MGFLYEKLDTLREFGGEVKIPNFIETNLSPNISLRDYQKDAIKNTLIYLNGGLSKNKQTHILYHMATGSGKTVIMAMDILYYYNLGYRNFLFFSNQKNIISKTKKNFLNNSSKKFLFSNEININCQNIKIKEVNNFSESDDDAINICFNTVQGIHSCLTLIREGTLTIEDFENHKVVLIADEAHHLNTTTIRDKEENAINQTWEDTVYSLLLANKDNVLLEFTATCDIKDSNVKDKYLDKIVFNFDLRKFSEAGYTKEFLNLRSNTSKWTRTLQAIIFSEYRKLMFEKYNVAVKPVVLLKSKTKNESKKFYEEYCSKIQNITTSEIEHIKKINETNELFVNAFKFFEEINFNNENIINLIKIDFSKENTINMNDESDVESQNQINDLDESNNHYRLVFIVDKLTEGWDVLSLFDIVRLYETRQGGPKGSISKYTISEAQLIGRGARYFPFKFEEKQILEKRKYSNYKNPLSICETLLYHCMDDSKYIDEIKRALKFTGLLSQNDPIQVTYSFKEAFKKTKTYLCGMVFTNKKIEISRDNVHSLPDKIRMNTITYKCKSGVSRSEYLLIDEKIANNNKTTTHPDVLFKDVNQSILLKAFRSFHKTLAFDKLLQCFPNLKSTKEFLTSPNYLGNAKISFITYNNIPISIEDKLEACKQILEVVSNYIQTIEIQFNGTTEFYGELINKTFKNTTRNITITNPNSWGPGVSQASNLVNEKYRIDLSTQDWYVYNDCFGTEEEKMFVKYFSTKVDTLKQTFKSVYLIRNEEQLSLYSFNDGAKFEPDFIIILNKNINELETKKNNLYICIYAEPKGSHLIANDSWKNKLLEEINIKAKPKVKYVDDNKYIVWGLPFYNEELTKFEFDKKFNELINLINQKY